jgi:hypothetical protein
LYICKVDRRKQTANTAVHLVGAFHLYNVQ